MTDPTPPAAAKVRIRLYQLPTERRLAQQIKTWRRMNNLTLREAARVTGIPLATFHRAERCIGHLTAAHYRTLVMTTGTHD